MKKSQLLNLLPGEFRVSTSHLLAVLTVALLASTAFADIQNGGFESGDYTGWTVSGNAWGSHPTNTDMGVGIAGWNGNYCALSRINGENQTGTLRSANFTLLSGERVDFLIGGWRSVNVPAESNWNYVVLCRASDDAELDRIYAPNMTPNMVARKLFPGTTNELEVYIKAVDDASGGAFAWMDVDEFEIVEAPDPSILFDFEAGTYTNWVTSGTAWGSAPVTTGYLPVHFEHIGQHGTYYANSHVGGETAVGTLRTINFTYQSNTLIRFKIAGWSSYGFGSEGGAYNYISLKRASDDFTYTNIFAPNQTSPFITREFNFESAYGEEVYIEVVDNCTSGGYAWLAVDYFETLPTYSGLYGVYKSGSEQRPCSTMPFFVWDNHDSFVSINATADTIHFLGMINEGWDRGCQHWGGHPENNNPRTDLFYINGNSLGTLKINYSDASSDSIPLIFGATIWSFDQWGLRNAREPFLSRPDCATILSNCYKLKEDDRNLNTLDGRAYFFLSVKPQAKTISSISVTDTSPLGRPLLSGITLENPSPTSGLTAFGPKYVTQSDRDFVLESDNLGDWSAPIAALAEKLYTHDYDLPATVEMIDYPAGLDAAKILFQADAPSKNFADMLSCMWMANIIAIDEKFYAHNGEFHESGIGYPHYGSYSGIGSWAPLGVYYGGIFGRCSDHFASLALRCIDNPERVTNYINYCDKRLYYFRSDHDPANGPPNPNHDISQYPTSAPPHWSFVISAPGNMPGGNQINAIFGDEEMDGHGATCVGRWLAWRHLGAPTNGWFTTPRGDVYTKSPWQSTIDSTEFICWLMDYYPARDTVYCEGETTGWTGGFEPYPTYLCMTALKCSAEMADAMGDTANAAHWRSYANRIHHGLTNELTVNYSGKPAWQKRSNSVYPSYQDTLVQAWFSFYHDGLDPNVLYTNLTEISRNTFDRQINQPWKHEQVLGMGYGQGWLAKAALILDQMDDAGILLTNLAKYSYDKNMNYVDESRGIDWRLYQWIIPEGANILPDGSWYRISDLGNGANQGIALHALELCAGIDDTHPDNFKILPRTPAPLTGLIVSNFPVLIPENPLLIGVPFRAGCVPLTRAKVDYSYTRYPPAFSLTSDKTLPTLSVRLGPYTESEATTISGTLLLPPGATKRTETSGEYTGGDAYWIWVEGMTDIDSVTIPVPEPISVIGYLLSVVGIYTFAR